MTRYLSRLAIMALLCAAIGPAAAQDETTVRRLWEEAGRAKVSGPSDIPFSDQAILHLPDNMAFIPVKESSALMRSWGNSVGDGFSGMIVSSEDKQNWVITVDQVKEGYVKDDDAKNWNADELLQSLKDGTEAQNEEREKMGIPALDVAGWVAPPQYESSTHRLVWSLKAVSRGAAAGDEATVNYNTYALGRDGYFEINLLTGMNTIDNEKPLVHNVLRRFEYNDGKRYQDFNEETDHIAEYGIAALIGGIAAKKLGLLAVIGVFLAKFAKIILVGVAVAGGAFMKFFRRNSA